MKLKLQIKITYSEILENRLQGHVLGRWLICVNMLYMSKSEEESINAMNHLYLIMCSFLKERGGGRLERNNYM